MVPVENPEKNPPNKVFISYAREDREWAAEKARTLKGVGQAYFLDYESIRAGDNWRETLEQQVETADRVWLIWSKYAAQSDWVRQEYLAALKKGKGRLRIDLLDSTPLPEELYEIQAERSPLTPPSYVTDRLLKEPTRELPEGIDLPPSVLLRAEYGVVPFVGRQELLEEYEQWCEEDTLFAVRLLTGAGGLGKTRFAIELCKLLRQKYWETAFVDRIEFESYLNNPEAANGLMQLRRPTLLVVDYAETRREQVKELFRAAKKKDYKQPVRVLLLARSEGEWWQQLLKESHDYEVLVGDASEPDQLLPAASDYEEREQIFLAAVSAFLTFSENAWPSFLPSLSKKEFEKVLFIHLAALAALDGKWIEEEDELLDFGVDRERAYWLKKAQDLDLSTELAQADLLEEGATMLVLAGGCDRQRLREVLKWQPELAELSRINLKQFGRVYSELYGVEERIEPLQPDLLGERLVELVLERNGELRTSWVKPSELLELLNSLTVLNRVAARKPDTESWLVEVFKKDLERSISLVVAVAQAGGDPIGRVLSDYLVAHPDSGLSKALLSQIPSETTSLLELADVASTQVLDSCLADQEERAILLNNHSAYLRRLGRREDALRASENAVRIGRQLAPGHSITFWPGLPAFLHNLGNTLGDLGRRDEALDVLEEAVELDLQMVQQRPDAISTIPYAVLPGLANSLSNLANKLSDLGRYEQAIRPISKAVEIGRMLAQAQPDTFMPRLAANLNDFGTLLFNLGQKGKAQQVLKESVDIRRKLALTRPDAFLPDLALSLRNFGGLLRELGQIEEALRTGEESIEIMRQLAETRPEAFLPDLAHGLDGLGMSLLALGKKEEALQAEEEAIEIRRSLAKTLPDTFLPCLASNLLNLGTILSDLGREEDALQITIEAVEIYRYLSDTRPEVFLPELATSLNNLGNRLGHLGKADEAIIVAKESLKIRRQLVQIRPEAYLPDLAMSLNNIGNRLRDLGRLKEALHMSEEAGESYRQLAQTQPDTYVPYLGFAEKVVAPNICRELD